MAFYGGIGGTWECPSLKTPMIQVHIIQNGETSMFSTFSSPVRRLGHIAFVREDLDISELDMRCGVHFGDFYGGVPGTCEGRQIVFSVITCLASVIRCN